MNSHTQITVPFDHYRSLGEVTAFLGREEFSIGIIGGRKVGGVPMTAIVSKVVEIAATNGKETQKDLNACRAQIERINQATVTEITEQSGLKGAFYRLVYRIVEFFRGHITFSAIFSSKLESPKDYDVVALENAVCSDRLQQQYLLDVEKFSRWSHVIESYNGCFSGKEWQSFEAHQFLYEEFSWVEGALRDLLEEAEKRNTQLSQTLKSEDFSSDLEEMQGFQSSLMTLLGEVRGLVATTEQHLETLNESPIEVRGVKNDGNTCYMNSALQPLLAVRNFENLIPEEVDPEPAYSYEERRAILHSFKKFMEEWKNHAPPKVLGRRVGALRRQIFEAGLMQGGFIDRHQERSYQDSGQFFELILHILGKGFGSEMTRIPMVQVGEGLLSWEDDARREETPEGVFYLKAPGDSVQEIVEGHREPIHQVLTPENFWNIQGLEVSNVLEAQKIIGEAPEVLVIRLDDHQVDPDQDFTIDFSPLFKEPSESCQYQLTGFAQNHSQTHWTSVVYDGEQWNYCNDSVITPVSPDNSNFLRPASYMVYQRLD